MMSRKERIGTIAENIGERRVFTGKLILHELKTIAIKESEVAQLQMGNHQQCHKR